MKKVSVKNLSLLGLVLMAASAVTAAVVPDKSSGKRANNGTLRLFSATAAGADQDAPQAQLSCIPEIESVMSCTATASNTTTGAFLQSSRLQIGTLYYDTVGNTSQTNPNDGVDQNSVLEEIED